MAKTTMQKAIELKNWETTVSNMNQVHNELYAYTNLNNKYYRFTDHMKGWIQGLFGMFSYLDGGIANLEPKDMNEEQKETALFMKSNLTVLQEGWWQVALSGDEKQKETLPKMEGSLEKEKIAEVKEVVYDNLLPAYRALKESFEKRWWIEIIFNHRQYTAERDALKVMTNMILSMTGDSMEELDKRYETYKVQVVTTDLSKMQHIDEERKVVAENLKKNAIEAEKDTLAEKGLEDREKIKEKLQKEEVKEIEAKTFDELTMRDQFTICKIDETFQMKLKEDFGKVIQEFPDKRFASVRKLMLGSHVLNPLLDAAENLCKDYDLADDQGANKEVLENVVKQGAVNIFKTALNATKNLKFTDAKERIVIAQKLTDIMLNSASPVSFGQQSYGQYGKGFTVLKNEEVIRSEMGDVSEAIDSAKETFGAMYPENKVSDIEQINVDLSEPKANVVPPVQAKTGENPVAKAGK